jgi:hypothetical protein
VLWLVIRSSAVGRLTLVLLIGTCAAMSGACTLGRASASPAIGDTCLIGSWTLDREVNVSGWSYSNIPVSVTGLAGARLTLAADGTETESFARSEPLVGTLADGRVLSITLGGSFTFHLHADGRQYVETGTDTALPVTATLSGVAISDYHGSYQPGTGTYKCSQQNLTTTTSSGVQTDGWSRR